MIFRLASFTATMFALFLFGFSWRDIQHGSLPSSAALASIFDRSAAQRKMSPTQEFTTAYDKIRKDYYKTVPPDELTYAGMEGLAASLGDPHTMFFEPKQAKEFSLETRANFVGVGARLSPDPMGAKVITVFEDGPADRAGLKAGDIITGVESKSMVGLAIDNIVSKIRGEEGTKVHLQVIRAKEAKPITLTATRAKVVTPTVLNSQILPDTQIGYFAISSFAEPTADQFDKELRKLEQQNIKGMVFDLRDNPGGLLETAVDMLSRFVEDKVVVKMRGRNGQEEVVKTYPGAAREFRYPIMILLNEDSASAAEIFSGVLQDYAKAVLVGTHSYGKASVQNVTPLVNGASAKITIARYFLPLGRNIGRKVDEDGQYISGGLTPDIKVELDADASVVYGDLKTDVQLQRAVEEIKKKTQG